MTNCSTYTPQQAHDDITALFDAYYDAKKAGDSIPPKRRNESADSIVEQYVEVNGERPPASVLSRLATYILLDTLSDSHPDKMSREEYPIMSDSQAEVRRFREHSLSDVYTGKNDETIGRYSDHDGVKRRIYDYMTPEKDNALVPMEFLELYTAMDNASLTARQREAIERVYFDDMTQENAAESMGVSDRAVRYFLSDGLAKIRRKMEGCL